MSKVEIISNSAKLFLSQGYNKTSVSDIAAKCGMFKSNLYHYFSSKEDIIYEVLNTARVAIRCELFAILKEENQSMESRIIKYINYIEDKSFPNGAGCLFANIGLESSITDNRIRQIIKEHFEEWIQSFYLFFKEIFDEEKSLALARSMPVDIEGTVMFATIFNDRTFYDDLLSRSLSKLK